MQLTEVNVQYQHDNGIMHAGSLSDLGFRKGELGNIINTIRDTYAVDVVDKYAGQESPEEFRTRPDWTYRSNVFAKKLKAETFTPEALVEAVQKVYAATEQFKNGVEQLRTAAMRRVEEKQQAVSSAFGV